MAASSILFLIHPLGEGDLPRDLCVDRLLLPNRILLHLGEVPRGRIRRWHIIGVRVQVQIEGPSVEVVLQERRVVFVRWAQILEVMLSSIFVLCIGASLSEQTVLDGHRGLPEVALLYIHLIIQPDRIDRA
jgi:hypothetical protein